MGGHGGLNILPQKRWNVYNRDNRTKVARDEAKAKKQDDEEQEKHMQAEREYRHRLLLQRAGHKEPLQEAEGAQTADGLLASIFDCKEEDSKAEHPENVEKRVEELRKRGNPDTQTSDAKFDERFAFAYGLGKVQPWYAKAPAAARADGPSTSTQGQPHDRLPGTQLRHDRLGTQQLQHAASAARSGSPAGSGSSSSEEERPRKRHKRDKHKQKKSHKSSKSKDKKLAKLMSKPAAKTVEELRAERVQRELAEKARSRSFLRSTIPAEDAPGVYNTGFGYAAALKKRTRA